MRSPQLAKFLSYIVEAKLSGGEASIKAYSIAVDVFGRPATFDPQSDPIVRVQARRLRALLDQFYDEGHAQSGLRIRLPVGRYVPEFAPIDTSGAESEPAEPERVPQVPAPEEIAPLAAATVGPVPGTAGHRPAAQYLVPVVVVLVTALALAVAWLAIRTELPVPGAVAILPVQPSVAIGEFVNVSGNSGLDLLGREVASSLARNLKPFEDIEVQTGTQPSGRSADAGSYLVTGAINPSPEGYEVTALLTDAGGATVWTGTYMGSLQAITAADAAGVARSIAREIVPYRGPLHLAGRKWLGKQQRPLPGVSDYVCMLTYRLARETGNSSDIADSLTCHERLLRDNPDKAFALSAVGWLETRAIVSRALPGSGLYEALEEPRKRIERAAALRPDSSLIREHLGSVLNWQTQFNGASRELVASLELNPLNTDARALYAILLARMQNWTLGKEQANLAIADTPYPAPWYYFPLALYDFRDGRMDEAIDAGLRSAAFGGGEVGLAIALAAAGLSDRQDIVAELRPRLMGLENLRRAGIIPWLSGQITDPATLEQVSEGLGRAGVPAGALTAAF